MRLAVVAGLMLATAAHAADFALGEQHYDAGRWRDALAELAPLAEQGDTAARFLAGAMLLDGGNGITRDRPRALVLLTQAAEQGHAGAMFELYLAQSDPTEALRWAARLASEGRHLQGHRRDQAALCAEVLGVEHSRGLRLPADPVRARAWLGVAVELGRGDAKPAVAALDEELTAEQKSRATALAATLLR